MVGSNLTILEAAMAEAEKATAALVAAGAMTAMIDDRRLTTTTTMDKTTTGDSDGGGCPCKFHSTARFDRVMGDAACDRRSSSEGVTKT